jgi:hypothetical protein
MSVAVNSSPLLQGHQEEQPAAEAALALIGRLKSYVLPPGRIPAARTLAHRLTGLANADSATILGALEAFEGELIKFGGASDPELAGIIDMVETQFPGARLVDLRRRRETES